MHTQHTLTHGLTHARASARAHTHVQVCFAHYESPVGNAERREPRRPGRGRAVPKAHAHLRERDKRRGLLAPPPLVVGTHAQAAQ